MATVFRLLAIPEATIDLSVGWNKCWKLLTYLYLCVCGVVFDTVLAVLLTGIYQLLVGDEELKYQFDANCDDVTIDLVSFNSVVGACRVLKLGIS